MSTSKELMFRLIWFAGSIIILLSFYFPYTYGNPLMAIIQVKISLIFDVSTNLSMTSLAALTVVISFILILFGGVFSLVFSVFAYQGSKLWNAPAGIRIWHASWLSFAGIVLMSSPIFVYMSGTLIQIVSIVDLQYWPTLEGLGIGYILTWIGVVFSLQSGRLVLRHKHAW